MLEVGLDVHQLVYVDERVLEMQVVQVDLLIVDEVDEIIGQLLVLPYVNLDTERLLFPFLVHNIQLVHPQIP